MLFDPSTYNDKNIKCMKTMTCKELGGACDLEFQAETFLEMAELSKNHGIEMTQKGDKDHLDAMNEMMQLMQSKPESAIKWFEEKQQLFNDRKED